MSYSASESTRFSSSVYVAILAIQLRSAPAEKEGPLPVRTTERGAVGLASATGFCATEARTEAVMSVKARVISSMTCSLKALWRSGRLSVTYAVAPLSSDVRYLNDEDEAVVDITRAAEFATFEERSCTLLRRRPSIST